MPHGSAFNTRQYMLDNAFEAFYYTSTDLTQVVSHAHDYYEIFLFESGDVTYVVGEKEYALLPGDILLIAPQAPHHPVFNNPDSVYSRLVLWISPAFMESANASCRCNFTMPFDIISEHQMHLLRLKGEVRDQLFEIVYKMATLGPSTYARARNNIALLDFLVRLNTQYAHYNYQEEAAPPGKMVQIVDYINNNLTQPLTLDAVADHFYISKYHLSHEFKRVMGTSVYRYINRRRVFRSHHLIQSGHTPGEVSRLCGFADYSAFYRAFRAEYGVSPRALSATPGGAPPAAP